jgi:hypothetical protein
MTNGKLQVVCYKPVLRIQTIFLWIQILLFDPDPDPYHFKEIMYLKEYFLYILTGPPGTNQKAYFVKF